MVIVPPSGPTPCDVYLIGEAPGKTEAEQLQPFVGRAGEEQEQYLSHFNLTTKHWRKDNVRRQYLEGNPDPSPEEIQFWLPHVLQEIRTCNPRLIVAVGRYAARFFLGDEADLETVHGLPHKAGAFDFSRVDRAPVGCTILPVTHPASGFYKVEARSIIHWDYSQVAETLSRIKAGKRVDYRIDEYEGKEEYRDVSGQELAELLDTAQPSVVGFDTEGMADDPWSLQVSFQAGTGYLLRVERGDFEIGLSAIRRLIQSGCTFVGSNIAMHDIEVCRSFGLDLSQANLFDTMYAAYLLRLEPQGLKPLAWRWCGMKMLSHEETVGVLGTERQVEYLQGVLTYDWPKPEMTVELQNDGTFKTCKPWSINRRVENILEDFQSGKVDKDGNPTDIQERWKQIDKGMRRQVEEKLGNMPIGSMRALAEKDFYAAVTYSCRDADAGFRLYPRLQDQLRKQDLLSLMTDGMQVLPVFEEMQSTGMPASRQRFQALADEMQDGMSRLQARISHRYFEDRPFNPKSSQQVGSLLRRRGLKVAKRTKLGSMSTSKASIEHLRYTDEAIADVFEWREHEHTKSSFCDPILEQMPESAEDDIYTVRCRLLTTRTTTRRLASKDPNLLAQPKHSEYGKRVRDCYVCREGEVFAEFDLSQIEVRMLAHESADPLLCQLFIDGRDIHSETAAKMFGVRPDDVTKVQRFFAKRTTFGTAYGIGGSGLATQMRVAGATGWDEKTCEKFIKEWLRLYKGAAKYFAEVEKQVMATSAGVVRDCWKMPRYLPAVHDRDRKLASEARRQAINHRIQGGAQGLIQKTIIYLRPIIRSMQESGLNIRWALEYHDSLMFIMLEELFEIVAPIVMDGLVNHCGMKLRIPVEAEASMAKSWGQL